MKKKIILAVGAHPDDIDFVAGGTIAKLANEGAEIYYLVCTDGSMGSKDPKMTPKKLSDIREKEQIEAGKILGIKDVFFLNYTDTQLFADHKLREDIAKIIKKTKPNIIITWDPNFFYSKSFNMINHTDHRAAGVATMDACYPLARDRLIYPEHENEGLTPHSCEEIWFMGRDEPSLLIDVTQTFEKKLKALFKHESQFENFEKIKEKVKEWGSYFGKKKGYKYAENFIRIKIS